MKTKKYLYLLKFYDHNNKIRSEHYTNKLRLDSIFNNHVCFSGGFIEIYNNKCYNYMMYKLEYKRYRKNKDYYLHINVYNEFNVIINSIILMKRDVYDYEYRLYNKTTLNINDIILQNDKITLIK